MNQSVKTTRACLFCGKEREVYTKSFIARPNTGNYCSRSCVAKHRNLIDNPAKKPDVRKKISDNHADVSGKNNPMYGRKAELAPSFKGYPYRKKALMHKGEKCEKCGEKPTGYNLHVHHKDRNRKNNKLSNLMVLCAKCHSKLHHENNVRKRDPKTGRFMKGSDVHETSLRDCH